MRREIKYLLITVFCLISQNIMAEDDPYMTKMQSEMCKDMA